MGSTSTRGTGIAAASPLTGEDSIVSAAGTEIPKSPPKWPLRPGVLAYVKGDTKQNICAARNATTTTSAMNHSLDRSGTVVSESQLNKSTGSYVAAGNNSSDTNTATRDQQSEDTRERKESTVSAPGDRVLRKALKTIILSEDVAIQVEEDDDEEDDFGRQQEQNRATGQDNGDETNVDELINFTNSNFINRILKRLRWKRNRGGFDNRRSNNSPSMTNGPKKAKKSRRRLLLLRKMPINGLFGSWKSTNSHTELFDSTRNRPAGIKYPSSGNICICLYLAHFHGTLIHILDNCNNGGGWFGL